MYTLWLELELGAQLLLFIFSWIASGKSTRIVYARSTDAMRRRVRKLWFWTVLMTLPAAGALACIWKLITSFEAPFWEDQLYLHAPLFALPAIAVWLFAVPNMIAISFMARNKGTTQSPGEGGEDTSALEPRLLQRAASPWLTIPFSATALGALTGLYFGFVPPNGLTWQTIGIPLAVYAAALAGVYLLHRSRTSSIAHTGTAVLAPLWKRALRSLAIVIAAAACAAYPVYAAQQDSLMPEQLNMMAGVMDTGIPGARAVVHDHLNTASASAAVTSTVYAAEPTVRSLSVPDLTGPLDATPDRRFELTAEHASVTLSSGKKVDAWTYNGEIPGPELRMRQGELVEVTLKNRDIEAGVTLHWHGLDVPNAEDGVAGATQNAVMPGETYTYRFRANQAGTFWYHSHQMSKEAVSKGLFGALIVEPSRPIQPAATVDLPVITHDWEGAGLAIGSADTLQRKSIPAGTHVRLRLLNTDDWIMQRFDLIGVPFQVAAIDGTDLHEPSTLQNVRLSLIAGGRYDVTFTMPDRSVFLRVGRTSTTGLLMSPDGKGDVPSAIPTLTEFDPLHYGTPASTPFGINSRFDRTFTMKLDSKMGFFNGRFGSLHTINGEVLPNTPIYMVREGDLVKTTIINRGTVDHPMHLHGHHMLVLSRNGVPSDGSPWWSDTLAVAPGETYEVAFRADNPGIWMDHCHNLEHAASGMVMHLMYEGVTTPYSVGTKSINKPE